MRVEDTFMSVGYMNDEPFCLSITSKNISTGENEKVYLNEKKVKELFNLIIKNRELIGIE